MSTLPNVNLEEVRGKLYERLKESGWGDKLKTFFLSNDFKHILDKLYWEREEENKRFTPPLKQVFRAFECCPVNNLKVVMIGQDPYPQIGVADGISFSCSNTGKPEASLRYIFKALEETVYKDGYTWDPNLERWSEQGILMLNRALTTNVGKVGTHYSIWHPFIVFVLDYLSIHHPGIIYVFLGKKAEELADLLPENSHKLFVSHPASAAYHDLERWECNDVFNKVSDLVQKQFNEKIIW